MSIVSSNEQIQAIRMPRLKFKDRTASVPTSINERSLLHSSQPSASGTFVSTSDCSDTTTQTVFYSPHVTAFPSHQRSPTPPSPAVRVPKLAVRSRASGEDEQSHFKFPDPSPPAADDADAIQQATPLQKAPGSAGTTTSTARPRTGPRPNSSHALNETNLEQRSSQRSKKKPKTNGIFGFLTLKEPSAMALEQFAEQYRKQVEQKGGRAISVGLTGISDRKLPATVPRVNSKWDGLPDWAREEIKKERGRQKGSDPTLEKMAQNRRPNSQSGSVTTFDSGSSRGPPNSLASSTRAQVDMKKRSGRSSSQKSANSKESVTRIRNPSRPRAPKSRGGRSKSLATPPALSEVVGAVRAATSYFPEEPPPPLPQSQGLSQSSPATPQEFSPITHGHRRSISDPRLQIGMDNVAPLSFFSIGDDPAPAPTSISPESDEAPPPIPRKSSRRHTPQPSASSIKHPELECAISEGPSPADSVAEASCHAAWPLPLVLPGKSQASPTASIPIPSNIKAVFPPGMNISDTVAARPASSTPLATSHFASMGARRGSSPEFSIKPVAKVKREVNSPTSSLSPQRSSPSLRPRSPPLAAAHLRRDPMSPPDLTGFTHVRMPSSGTPSIPPSEPSVRVLKNPQERLGFGAATVRAGKNASDIAPWEIEDAVQAPNSSGIGSVQGGQKKKGRLGGFGARKGK